MPAAPAPQEEPLGAPAPEAEAPKKAPGAWSAEGLSLAETEAASFEKGRENFGAEKQEKDAQVAQATEEFTKANDSWWQKTKAAFSKAKSWVTNEEAIKKLDARALAAKEAYVKETEEAKGVARQEKYVKDRKETLAEREAQQLRLHDTPSGKMLKEFYSYEDQIGAQDEYGKIGDVRFNEESGEVRVIYAGDKGSLRKFPSGLVLRVMPGGKIETLEGAFKIKTPAATPELKVVPPSDESVDVDVSDLEGEEEEEPILLTPDMKKTAASAPAEDAAEEENEEPVLLTPDMKKTTPDATAAGEEKGEPILLTPEMRKPNANAEKERMRNDPRFKGLVEEKSLAYLKAKDASWFRKNYNGEVSPSGYLLDAKGKETNFLPSQNISIGIVQVEKEAEEAYLRGDATSWPTWARKNQPPAPPAKPIEVEEAMIEQETDVATEARIAAMNERVNAALAAEDAAEAETDEAKLARAKENPLAPESLSAIVEAMKTGGKKGDGKFATPAGFRDALVAQGFKLPDVMEAEDVKNLHDTYKKKAFGKKKP